MSQILIIAFLSFVKTPQSGQIMMRFPSEDNRDDAAERAVTNAQEDSNIACSVQKRTNAMLFMNQQTPNVDYSNRKKIPVI
ncbi:MAG: hypothetical protein GY705_27675 [Bacteroidetes bacterium]|nr:hypothetical protein [Bacteroidota bacterium]